MFKALLAFITQYPTASLAASSGVIVYVLLSQYVWELTNPIYQDVINGLVS